MIKLIEIYRKEIIKYLFEIKSFSQSWENSWKKEILTLLNNEELNEVNFFKLGENLRRIFLLTSSGDRGQGEVSSAGTGWESLLAWYLNLGLIGTRTIVIKPKKEFNFDTIQKTITVNYGNFISNSESDLIAVTFPQKKDIAYSVEKLEEYENKVFSIDLLEKLDVYSVDKINLFLNKIIENNISKIEVNVIQCKTNWNDNAQIPMGWDIIYSSTGFTNENIKIGRDGFSIHKIKDFKYSFITVPTQKDLDKIKKTSTQVLRVNNLSGGIFWGAQTKVDVAKNISEIFNDNFSESYKESSFYDRIKNVNLNEFGL
ncbi:hypothetical protein [Fusobacterium polymorphum]|uniref:hypothetical protein n=1 Tax=Fusobacterium nucleatum subsp. polymorphum TaxID=76857 RepID=UPI00300887EB